MAVEYSKTIRGITYTQGQSFNARVAGTWYGSSDGTGGSGSIAAGHTCKFQFYQADYSWQIYNYCIDPDSSGASDQEWTSIDIFPFATYTVKYNANGGTGAPANQTKTWGTNLTLSSTAPTRTGYAFKGWATSSGSTTVKYQPGATYSANAALNLYAVWEATAATLTSVATMTTGSAVSIKWTPNATTHTFRLKIVIGSNTYWAPSSTGYISPATTSAYTYTGYTIPAAAAAQITTAESGTATVTLYSFLNGTQLGTSSKTATVVVNSSVVPTISSVALSNATTTGFTGWIKTLSKVKAVITASGAQGSTITSYQMTVDGAAYTSSTSTVTATNFLKNKGTVTVTAKVTDSRGRTATNAQSITVVDYFSPTISDIVADVDGTTVTCSVTYAIAPVNDENAKNLKITCTKVSTSTSTVITPTLSEYSGTYTWTQTLADAETETYQFTAELWDTKTAASHTVASTLTAVTALSLLRGGRGAAFFGEATREGLEVKGKTIFDNQLQSIRNITDANDCAFVGLLTSSGHKISFVIPYDEVEGCTATITSLSAAAYGIAGALNTAITEESIESATCTPFGIRVVLYRSSGWGGTNNTPAVVVVHSITMSITV